ncbi:MFS transporter [Iamia majanohamensis]|uniref:MFS transporter n=1 Tax=Iamia majanohamensis TaxID=467976 RepID=A0AAE9YFZ4_9ACTN|nr:MFS transporter [Iamia majanohamensis]WCO67832.1 MFS transporter [Iamia majanohamensis]
MGRWKALLVLGIAQFLMVLDSAVMNVSISTLVEDFDTDVTVIQGVITMYALVMAAFMVTGGKVGDLLGRRRAFVVGMVVYGCGSALTAVAPTVGALALGWSVLEGLGAALVMPALAALVAGNYEGRDRATAYAVIGGLAGAGVAVGPLLGGWVTTNLTWRLVFAGEVVLVVVALLLTGWIRDVGRAEPRPHIDGVGIVLSASGLAVAVYGVLQSATWGWLAPRSAPFEVLGFAPTPFVIGAGLALLWAFAAWQRRREGQGRDPLVRMALLVVPPLRAGLTTQLAQTLILLGFFFAIPLYLQVVQGLDAFETGIRLLPVSVTMLLASLSGPLLSRWASPRTVVRLGLGTLVAGGALLLGTIDPVLDDGAFAVAMAVIGTGNGLIVSQLGNVLQSSVDDQARSEVGGLQYTAQQLGAAIGTAFIGAVAIGALASAFLGNVEASALSAATEDRVTVQIEAGVGYVPVEAVEQAATDAALPPDEVDELVEDYADAQLGGLRAGVLAGVAVALVALGSTPHLPSRRPRPEAEEAPAGAGATSP